MKFSTFIIVLFLFCLFSCEKDDFVYSYIETDKLLVSVIRLQGDSEFRAEFEYDSSNRIIEIKNIFQEGDPIVELFIYNEDGNMAEKISGNYMTFYTYNSAGQLIEQNLQYFSSEDGYKWEQKTEYKYKNGRINKGVEYSREHEVMNYISYKYDSRGNTLEKNVNSVNGDYNLSETKFRYDTKINVNAPSGVAMPGGFIYSYYPDIKQMNNPVYSSYSNLLMSSLPPEYEISYDYDSEGLALRAEMKNIRFPEQEKVFVEYEYRDKE